MSKVFFCVGRLKSSRPSSRLFDGRRLGRQGKQKEENFRLTFILCWPVPMYSARDGIVYLYWRSHVNVAMTTRGTLCPPNWFFISLCSERAQGKCYQPNRRIFFISCPLQTQESSDHSLQHFLPFNETNILKNSKISALKISFESDVIEFQYSSVIPQQNFGLGQWTDVLKCVKQAEETLPPLQCRQMFLLSTANNFSDRKQF